MDSGASIGKNEKKISGASLQRVRNEARDIFLFHFGTLPVHTSTHGHGDQSPDSYERLRPYPKLRHHGLGAQSEEHGHPATVP